ncbi:MAG TPA: chromosome partitioning protein ParB, partial [Dokdonella sp.]
MAAKKRGLGLGRGLDALLGGGDETALAVFEAEGELRTLGVGLIQPGKYQPRLHIDPDRLNELAASIK